MKTLSELDILKIAVTIEEDGAKFYNNLCEHVKEDIQKQNVFRLMINEEKNHAKIFKDFYKQVKEEKNNLDNGVFKAHIPQVVKSLVDYFIIPKKDIFLKHNITFKEIIDEAVVQEYRSIEFYYSLAQHAQSKETKRILHAIIREEEKHVIKLKEMIYFRKENITIEEHIYFVENVLNGMQDWVRVIDLQDNIIYANNAMKKDLGYYLIGRKCFEVIGRDTPCENCISQRAISEYEVITKEEHINDKVYSVISSPLKDLSGEVTAIIEVMRDITEARQMQDAIKNQNKKHTQDLKIARKMQLSLLPDPINTPYVQFKYIFNPSEMIGGDFFDVFKIDNNHIGVYIADVSGHGLAASMLTMYLTKAIDRQTLSPAKTLKKLFKEYNNMSFDKETYITMFYATINLESLKMRYANAGQHTLPIVYNANKKELVTLEARGLPISRWMEDTIYEEHTWQLEKGDCLMLYTDGVIELNNGRGEQYGIKRLEQFLLENKSANSDIIKNKLEESLKIFANESGKTLKKNIDDITALFLEIL